MADILELADDSLVAADMVTKLYEHLGVQGQVHIHALAELDEPEVGVTVTLLTFAGIGDDTSCHGAGNLTDSDDGVGLRLDHHERAFVFGG